jgi:glycosyltransferase involved in cell wall biosynthesis
VRRTTDARQSSHATHAAVAPKRRRSIVYVWDSEYPWDVRTEKVCRALAEAGHSVRITARNRKRRPAVEDLAEGRVMRMRPAASLPRTLDHALSFPAFFNPRWVRLIERAVMDVGADMIIVRDLPLCPTAVHVGRRFGIPVVLDMAENYPAMMRALWETDRHTLIDYVVRNPRATSWVERYSVKAVDHIITVVEESAERVHALGVPRAKLSVISNTPPRARVRPRREHASRATTDVVYMGNLEVARGLLEAIEAVAILRDRGVSARLRIIGRGRDEALLRARAAELGLDASSVEFLGFIESHEEALGIVAASDVGLIPHRKCESWDTTIPNKLFDYMAAGIPTVSSNAAPCERIIEETGAGEIFVSGDAASLADAIVRASAPGRGRELGEAGQRAVLDRYNWEHDTGTLLGLLDRPELRAPDRRVRVLP